MTLASMQVKYPDWTITYVTPHNYYLAERPTSATGVRALAGRDLDELADRLDQADRVQGSRWLTTRNT
jgi:hypothetical protein